MSIPKRILHVTDFSEHPAGTAAGVTLMVAASLLVGGLARIFMAVLERFGGWGWTVCSGVVAVLLGALISRQWPTSGFWVSGARTRRSDVAPGGATEEGSEWGERLPEEAP
jgi:hypothetical protein